MTTRILAAIGLGTCCLLSAAGESKQDEPKQNAQVSNTQRIDFPAGGTLRFKNAIGVLTVEAWDRPDVEITTIKSTKAELDARGRERAGSQLEKVHVAAERSGNELVVTTTFPRRLGFPSSFPPKGEVNFRLEYRIKAPAAARVVDGHHDVGEVNIDGMTSDIDVNLLQGEIMVHLPEEGQYNIHAKSDFGSVNSDFSELEKRTWWLLGHRSVNANSAAAHKLNLKVGFGDVVLLKIRTPKAPDSLLTAGKTGGL
jgi:hypothetical protein